MIQYDGQIINKLYLLFEMLTKDLKEEIKTLTLNYINNDTIDNYYDYIISSLSHNDESENFINYISFLNEDIINFDNCFLNIMIVYLNINFKPLLNFNYSSNLFYNREYNNF